MKRARKTLVLVLAAAISACGSTPTDGDAAPPVPVPVPATSTFSVAGAELLQNGRAVTFAGANHLHVYGGNSDAKPTWRVSIVREFIRNLNDQPIAGAVVYSATSTAYFHSLRSIVDNNRRNGLITVFC